MAQRHARRVVLALPAGMGTLVALLYLTVRAADAPQKPRPEQGLSITFEAADAAAATKPDTRAARMLALYVPEGAPPTPFLPPGRFKATWAGDLNMRLRERMSFSAEGRGKLTVSIKDKVVFQAEGEDLSQKAGEVVRIDKGANPLVVTYESPERGDAWVRVNWKEQRGLRAEPVPPTSFTHDAAAAPVAAGERVRSGRQLVADLRCTKCHGTPATENAMPELATDAPSLTDVGARLNRDWMAAWVADPKAFRKDAHMPRVFHGEKAPAQAADVAAYLATFGSGATQEDVAAEPDAVARGGQLFASLNCVACHAALDAADAPASDPRVPLGYVRAKFTPRGLRQYLLDPTAHYPWNPMPNFKLLQGEAAALSAYLLGGAQKTVNSGVGPAAGDAESGRQLVRSSGCLNCHTLEGETTGLKSPELAAMDASRWDRGCAAADPAGRKEAPDFALGESERAALLAFAATDRSSLARDSAAEFSARQVAAMRCTACHARDGKESAIASDFAADLASLSAAFPPPQQPAGAEAHGEIFAPDQRPPMLTWAGEKLRPEWAAAFVAGKVPYKPRPYLRARMPAWSTRAEGIARGLAAEHGYSPATPAYPAPDESLAPVGHKLVGTAGGFSCVQCHAVGDAPPLAPFEAPALNFAHVSERLRKDHYLRWVFNPIKVDPNTKMPAFADADGKSALRDVYEGDAGKQFEAIWQFLLRGKDAKPPPQ